MSKRRVRILIVDHNAESRQEVARHVEALGFEPLMTENGAVGLGLAIRQRPSMIILALDLPPRGGALVLNRLKETPATAAIPVIMVSDNVDRAMVVESLRKGATDFLLRPVDEGLLRRKISDRIKLSGFEEYLQKRETERLNGTAANGTAANGTAANGTAANGTAANGASPSAPRAASERRSRVQANGDQY